MDEEYSSEEESSSAIKKTKHTTKNWPRFLVVSSIDDSPLRLNPFLTSKAVNSLSGEVQNIKKIKNGFLLIECKTQKQSQHLLSLKEIGTTAIKVSPHNSLNSSKAIIRDKERCLSDMSEKDLLEELRVETLQLPIFWLHPCQQMLKQLPVATPLQLRTS